MTVSIRELEDKDLPAVLAIWNEVIDEGGSFPFVEPWTLEQFAPFIAEQTRNVVAVDDSSDCVVGFYTLHPNMIGRCSTGANATYLVDASVRGQHIGEKLVLDSIDSARRLGFRYMQFNGVVDSNIHARHLYERCGFHDVGVIPKGFMVKDGSFEDMHIMYLEL